MRKVTLVVWLMLPVLFGFYHMGPGQERMQLDQFDSNLNSARQAAESGDWSAAEQSYVAALESLPEDRKNEAFQVRLDLAKAQMQCEKLSDAYNSLLVLVDELDAEAGIDENLIADAKSTLANSRYYVTWLARLEGESRDLWEPEIEAARQSYRLLAEEAITAGNQETALAYQEDLESTIRLARMDLSELQALDLPSQCKGCKTCDCNCQGKKPGKKKGRRQPKDARGAGAGPPPEDGGS